MVNLEQNGNAQQLISSCGSILNNKQEPLKKRFRALFTLRNLGGLESIKLINQALLNDESVLLKHECCYCLGQMNDTDAVDYLISILDNELENEIVRHEAAEALGNLVNGDQNIIDILEKNLKDKSHIVNQTCELALNLIKWRSSASKDELDRVQSMNPYKSKDPAPPFLDNDQSINLKSILLDQNSKLFDKYRCLFTLRNRGQSDDIQLLGESLVHYKGQDNMSLFKHEIGYIFGQMQSPVSIPYLQKMVECKTEGDIVRHECAEALGSVATIESLEFLKNYLKDDRIVVRQSAEVALDMIEYNLDDTQFNFIAV